MKSYKISKKPIVSYFYKTSTKALRDAPIQKTESAVQAQYMDLLISSFLRTLVKVYAPEAMSDADKTKLRKYLDRIIEAKTIATGEEPKGGFYKRES